MKVIERYFPVALHIMLSEPILMLYYTGCTWWLYLFNVKMKYEHSNESC